MSQRPGSFVSAADILASDSPADVVRKLDAAWEASTPATQGIDFEPFRRLVEGCEAEFTSTETEELEPDDSKVSYPEDRCSITFGMIRNARKALDASPKGSSDAPDMFWNDADPERAFDSIIELVSQEWSNGSVVAGDVMEIQQAIRLPNIKVRVVESEDDGVDYEEAPNTLPACPKCSGTGFVECGASGPFVRSGSIQCDCMQATSAEVRA